MKPQSNKCNKCIFNRRYHEEICNNIIENTSIVTSDNTPEKKKLVLFIVNGMSAGEFGIGSTLPLMMEEDETIEYATIVYIYGNWKAVTGLFTPINCLAENIWRKMSFVIPFLPIPSHSLRNIIPDLTEYIKAFTAVNGNRYEKILLVQLNSDCGNEIYVDEMDNVEALNLGIGLYPRKFKNYYFDLLGYDGNCGVGHTSSFDFCEELVTRSLPEIKECIRRLLNGDDIPHQTFTDDIEPYRMYEGH